MRASNAMLGKSPAFGCFIAYRHPPSHGRIDTICAVESSEMRIKPPIVTEMDLLRARQIVRPLAPLKGLNSDDAEIVARIIALSFAEGRQRGLDIAMDWCDDEWQQARAKGCAAKAARVAGD
jgi:hypothetical protein